MNFAELRRNMVRGQLADRGIRDPRVLEVFGKVPRERFVPPELQDSAYDDNPLGVGHGQTISQPYIVALMTEALALRDDSRVLEIGTGSGYQAAILAELAGAVFSVERINELAERARRLLAELGYRVEITVGDGTLGWPEHAPYDGIIVTAAGPEVPPSLIGQLADGGRLVVPVGDRYSQDLVLLIKQGETMIQESLGGCRFVPLVGREGWPD